MKIKMFAFCRIKGFLTAILINGVLITGGVKAAERQMYELVAENNASKVITSFRVYADSERDARENVALNGWKILSLQQINYKTVDLSASGKIAGALTDSAVGDRQTSAPSSGSGARYETQQQGVFPGSGDDDIINQILRANAPSLSGGGEDRYAVAKIPAPSALTGSAPASDAQTPYRQRAQTALNARGDTGAIYQGIEPDASNLNSKHAVFFGRGHTRPTLTEEDEFYLDNLPSNRRYFLFGHADNLRVIPNPHYKDNFDVSFQRSENIRKRMEVLGIDPASINTTGLGELYPVVENRPGGTPENRRVEIYEYQQ